MPSTVSGPGFSGASEIGAVAVGVVLDQGQLAASLESAHARLGAAAPGFRAEGRKAGQAHGEGLAEGVVHGAGRLRIAMRSLHHLFYAATAAFAVKGAFDVGVKIGNAIFRGAQGELEDQQEALTAATQKVIESARRAAFEASSKAQQESGLPPLDVSAMEARAGAIAQENAKIKDLHATIEQLKREYADLDHVARSFTERQAEGQEARSKAQAILDQQMAAEKELEKVTAERAANEQLNTNLKTRALRLTEEQLAATVALKQEESASRAQRDVDPSRTAADISSIRSSLDIMRMQRTPRFVPGNSVEYPR